MESSNSILPDRFRGLRVLLVEPDKSAMQYHAHILSRNAYNVTSTTDATHGLSNIMKGETFECVLVDADINEMNIMEFLHRILTRQPQLSVIIMASGDTHMRLTKEALSMGAIMCLRKPCAHTDISGIWKYVCTRKTTFPKANSNQNFPEENQALNIDERPDSMFMSSTNIDGRTVIEKSISSSHHIQRGLNGIYGSMFNLVTNEDIFLNYDGQERFDGTTIQEVVGTSTSNVTDKGKHALEHDSNDQSEKYHKKRKFVNHRVTWIPEPHEKFVGETISLDNQNAYPSSNIQHMNVLGLERNNMMSHPQVLSIDFQETEDTFKIPNKLAPWERGNNFHVESYAWKRGSGSTLSDNDTFVTPSSNLLRPLKLNSGGISFMIIANIKAKLQASPQLSAPLETTTINNSHGIEETNYSFGEPYQPLQDTTSSTFCDPYQPLKASTSSTCSDPYQPLKALTNSSFGDPYHPLNGQTSMNTTTSYMTIENIRAKLLGARPSGGVKATNRGFSEKSPNSGQRRELETEALFDCLGNSEGAVGSGVGDSLSLLDCFVNATDPWRDGAGSNGASSDLPPEPLVSPVFFSYDLENLYHDVQGNQEDMLPDYPLSVTLSDIDNFMDPNFSNVDYVSFGFSSGGIALPNSLGEGNNSQTQIQPPMNSIFQLDSSQVSAIDDDTSFLNDTEFDIQMTINLLDEVDDDILRGPW